MALLLTGGAPSELLCKQVPAIFINGTFIVSIVSGVLAGAWQGRCEGRLHQRQPGRFPPSPLKHIGDACEKYARKRRPVPSAGAVITELELENERTGGMAGGGYDEGRSEASTASPYAPRIRVSQQV